MSTTATLYVVATPIGNLQDCSARLRATLAQVAIIYAEDTRNTRILLQHLQLQTSMQSLHAFNEKSMIAKVLQRLDAGESVALVSDAGTPSISDPGVWLLDAVWQHGHRISPIAGPSSLTAALSVSGLVGDNEPIWLVGFLPLQRQARQCWLQRLAAHPGVAVLFEAPHRVAKLLQQLSAQQPHRQVLIARELTKHFEQLLRCHLEEAAAWAQKGPMRGEFTLVLGPIPPPPVSNAPEQPSVRWTTALQRCLEAGYSLKDATTILATAFDVPKKAMYQQALLWQSQKNQSAK